MLSPLLDVYKRCNLEFTSGKGSYLKSKDGKKYLDFAAGIAVNALGYAHPRLSSAITKAAKKPWHVSNLYHIAGQENLAQKLVANSSCDQVFFCNSGAETIETAVKIIRKNAAASNNPKRHKIITFEHAFHGRTMTAISAGGSKKYQEGYAPLVSGFVNVPLKHAKFPELKKYVKADVAAIALEPIQGEGGVNVFSKKFLKELYEFCQAEKILLLVDEVQCGMGRTGKLFHYQWSGIKPDIICVAKGIGGGFPLGACLVKKEYGKAMTPGSHGGTYGGSPLAMSVGNAVIDEILKPNFLHRVQENGKFIKSELIKFQVKFPELIKDVRGEGLMLGLEINGDYTRFAAELRAAKLLTVPASNNVIRIIPPLNIKKKDLQLGLNIIKNTLENFSND